MKVAVITDTHFGARNDSKAFADYFYKFYNEVFFPYLKEHNIHEVVHCGDLMDRRKYVNFDTLSRMRKEFIDPLLENDITMHVVVGNHDTYYKNTVEVNSVEQLFDIENEVGVSPILAYSEPAELIFEDFTKVDIIPWINQGNEEQVMEFVDKSKNPVAFGHFVLSGFEMHKGVKSMYHSRSSKFLDNYTTVYSGHFHTKSDNGHVYYLGNPYEMTWSDYNDDRGFHVYDTETFEVEHIVNPFKLHVKVQYDEDDKKAQLSADYTDKIVKLIVTTKDDFEHFNTLVEKINDQAETLTIVEDYGLLSTDQVEIDMEDTITTLNKYVDGMGLDNTKPVKKLIQELYVEALAM